MPSLLIGLNGIVRTATVGVSPSAASQTLADTNLPGNTTPADRRHSGGISFAVFVTLEERGSPLVRAA